MSQTVISAKWTDAELALMDSLIVATGAESRSHLLRIALLTLAVDQKTPHQLRAAAERSRLSLDYRPMNPTRRAELYREHGAAGRRVAR